MSEVISKTPKTEPELALERGNNALNAGNLGEAAGIASDLISKYPDWAPGIMLKGAIHTLKHEYGDAIDCMTPIEDEEKLPAEYLSILSVAYRMAGRYDEAHDMTNAALIKAPDNGNILLNAGLLFRDLERLDDARLCLLKAVSVTPTNADAHLALAELLLQAGEWGPGWVEYEWRNLTSMIMNNPMPKITSPQWNGMRIPGGRILVICDQGYGDVFQFMRFIPQVRKLCDEVVVGCSKEMVPILASMEGVSKAFYEWHECPPHAAHTRVSSLPCLFHTTEFNLPSRDAYIFSDPVKLQGWCDSLVLSAKRVGLVWSGRPTHPNDKRRSMRLRDLAPLAKVPTVTWVSLQKPMPAEDREFIPLFRGMQDVSDDLHDFSDTAALIDACDTIVAVDTGVAHLAAAMGKRVLLMVPYIADWRWGRDITTSIWYQNVKIFRQSERDDWRSVVEDVAQYLTNLVN